MALILVSGLINIETTLQIDSFPLNYTPVCYPFFGVNGSVSGVGYNVTKALAMLGHEVHFTSLIGRDIAAQQVRSALIDIPVSDEHVLNAINHTPQSVILHDRNGRRQIHVDLKDIQQQTYPDEVFERAMAGCDLFALCNINFSRRFLQKARLTGKPIATDVHAIAQLDDEYNLDFMRAAHILFMSDERLPLPPEDWAREVLQAYAPEVVVIGLGAQGALLAIRNENVMQRIPAVTTRPIVNTIGAGDALFSAFLHSYLHSGNPYSAIRRAVVFASYKIGSTSAAEGFLNRDALERMCTERQIDP
ncbi:MAG: carbohydrate kinase family protein [Candidatus Aminicenantes bacterium]|nr:carbohydrate kinase family protein [Candidatus Aminicenantes bacterium]